MKLHRSTRRARPSLWLWLAVVVSALGAIPSVGMAQVRPDTVPADTLAGDTLVVPIPPEEMVRDTLPADSVLATPDSLLPAPRLPESGVRLPTGFAHARWEWSAADLLGFHGLSLLDLLERVPGLLVTRSGGFGRPAGVGFVDTGGGTVRVFRDGFEVDPLVSATPELQHIGLADIRSVRVERRLSEIRVELETFELDDRRAFSKVEAATGNFEAKILRALFSRAIGGRSVVTGAYDLTSTEGFTRDEPFSFGSGRARWTYTLSERTGLQAEYRFASVERETRLDRAPGDSLYREDFARQELVLRGRTQPFPRLTVDGLVARAARGPSDDVSGAVGGERESESSQTDRYSGTLTSTQAALLAAYRLDFGSIEASARARGGEAAGTMLPAADFAVRGVLQPFAWAAVEAEGRSVRMDEGQATRLTTTGRIGPLRGVSVFATASVGERWAGTVGDTVQVLTGEDTVEVNGIPQLEADTVLRPRYGARRASAGGFRAGAEWVAWGANLGAALVRSEASVAVPYGLAFDRGIAPLEVGAASGVEAYGSVPLPFFWPTLRLQGWYVNWLQTGNRPYLPLEQARLGLEFHGVFVEGEFEPTLRVETEYRGSSLAPSLDLSGYGQASEAYTVANLFLQIRILDVRAFLIFQNFLNNRTAADIPGLGLAGPRTLYGLRWHFRN